MVDNVQGRRFIAQVPEHLHQAEYVLGIVEVPGSYVLDLDHHGIERADGLQVERNVVRARRQLGVARIEDDLQVAPFLEQLVHITVMGGIPAVLGTETADFAAEQRLVQLVFQRGGTE